jgi:hypothetical protein
MLTSATAETARVGVLAGARRVGGGNGDHLREEDDETNPMVLSKATDDDG